MYKKENSMKKLTSLQIIMLMGLAVGSLHIQAKDESTTKHKSKVKHESKAQSKKVGMPTAVEDLKEAAALELQGAKDEQAKIEVLADLVEISPNTVEQIIKEEDNLKEDLVSIKSFIHEKNNEIEKLAQADMVSQLTVARLAVELADAQAILGQAIAEQRMKHKHNYSFEQTIKDALIKAEQGLKLLSQKAVSLENQMPQTVSQEIRKASKKVANSKTKKNKTSRQ